MPPDAMLRTQFLPVRLRRNLARGLDALMLELMSNRNTGYAPGTYDPRIDALVSDARQAYALGLIGYLPGWAK